MSKSTQKPSEAGIEKKSVEEIPQKSRKVGKTAKQIMSKHIKDKDDVITEEDFKNLNIELELPKDEAHQSIPIDDNTKRPKDEDKDPVVATPWDIIS
jgi:hypothetical protein